LVLPSDVNIAVEFRPFFYSIFITKNKMALKTNKISNLASKEVTTLLLEFVASFARLI